METNGTLRLIEWNKAYREAFARLNLQWIEMYFRVEPKDLEQVSNPEAAILSHGGQVFFLLEGETVVGTCAVLKHSEDLHEIAKMAVRPECRGRGYGNWLMRGSIEWSKRQGAREILILSNTVLEPAIELYKKFGFETIHLGPHPDYDRCDIEMRLRIET